MEIVQTQKALQIMLILPCLSSLDSFWVKSDTSTKYMPKVKQLWFIQALSAGI